MTMLWWRPLYHVAYRASLRAHFTFAGVSEAIKSWGGGGANGAAELGGGEQVGGGKLGLKVASFKQN